MNPVKPIVHWSFCDSYWSDRIIGPQALKSRRIAWPIAYRKANPTGAHARFRATGERISFEAARAATLASFVDPPVSRVLTSHR